MAAITAWRIVAPRWTANAFDGIGAEQTGGRFNSAGHRIVYTSDSLALAVLEILVQAGKRSRIRDHVCIPVTFDSTQVEGLEAADLPDGWDYVPYQRASQQIGDTWLEEQRSLVLRVPSVVIPVQYNYLINPQHPDFSMLQIGQPKPVPVDRRVGGWSSN